MNLLPALRAHWLTLADISVTIAVVLASFLSDPPSLSLEAATSHSARGFAQWIVAILSGLTVAVVDLGPRPSRRRWLTITWSCTVAAIVLFGAYMLCQAAWSATYVDGVRLIVGDTLSAAAEEAVSRRGVRPPPVELLAWFAGRSEEAWAAREVVGRAVVLNALFVLAWVSCAATMLVLVNLLSMPKQKASRKAAP